MDFKHKQEKEIPYDTYGKKWWTCKVHLLCMKSIFFLLGLLLISSCDDKEKGDEPHIEKPTMIQPKEKLDPKDFPHSVHPRDTAIILDIDSTIIYH